VARLRQECIEAKEALSVRQRRHHPGAAAVACRPRCGSPGPSSRDDPADAGRLDRRHQPGAAVGEDRARPTSPRCWLVGGSSGFPLVAELVSSQLGRPVAVDAHPKYGIALGAADPGGGHASAGTAGHNRGAGGARAPRAGRRHRCLGRCGVDRPRTRVAGAGRGDRRGAGRRRCRRGDRWDRGRGCGVRGRGRPVVADPCSGSRTDAGTGGAAGTSYSGTSLLRRLHRNLRRPCAGGWGRVGRLRRRSAAAEAGPRRSRGAGRPRPRRGRGWSRVGRLPPAASSSGGQPCPRAPWSTCLRPNGWQQQRQRGLRSHERVSPPAAADPVAARSAAADRHRQRSRW
jgi:hypothetical protein